MIAALAQGPSFLSNFSSSQDCASTLKCLQALGVGVSPEEKGVRIDGKGLKGLSEAVSVLDCGNSGSTMRMLAGVLAGQSFASELTGDKSLLSRPMQRIIEPLELMGAQVDSVEGKPPIRISRSEPLRAIRYTTPVASAQVKSCILLAGLNAVGSTTVMENVNTRDHTERMLGWFEVPISIQEDSAGRTEVSLAGETAFAGREVSIPGDISSAAFLIAAGVLLPDSKLEIQAVGLNPTRTQFLAVLESLGAQITFQDVQEVCREPVGNLIVQGGLDLTSSETRHLSGAAIAQLIDELPLLAVVGSQLPGGLIIRDAAELRVKESDRLATTVSNLRAMGADVEEYSDGLAVGGRTRLRGALLDSHGDHRIAMAFAIAALMAEGDSEILGSECVAVSFPNFFQLLESLSVPD